MTTECATHGHSIPWLRKCKPPPQSNKANSITIICYYSEQQTQYSSAWVEGIALNSPIHLCLPAKQCWLQESCAQVRELQVSGTGVATLSLGRFGASTPIPSASTASDAAPVVLTTEHIRASLHKQNHNTTEEKTQLYSCTSPLTGIWNDTLH